MPDVIMFGANVISFRLNVLTFATDAITYSAEFNSGLHLSNPDELLLKETDLQDCTGH
jgi:hypothetical protein